VQPLLLLLAWTKRFSSAAWRLTVEVGVLIMLLAGMIKVLSMNYDSGMPSRNHEAEVSVQNFLGRRILLCGSVSNHEMLCWLINEKTVWCHRHTVAAIQLSYYLAQILGLWVTCGVKFPCWHQK
jgi:hypothetical protein